MELRGKHVLVISPEAWNDVQLSKHHLTRALVARGNNVCFWGPPEKDGPRLSVTGDAPLRHVRYRHWFRGVNRLPLPVHQAYYRHLLNDIVKAYGRPFDMIWCFDTTRMQWFPKGYGLRVLHLVDHDVLDTGQGLIRDADILFTVTEPLRQHALALRPEAPVHFLGHAIEERWLQDAEALVDAKAQAAATVAYAGHLRSGYVDWELMHAMASAHPELPFELYGPYDLAFQAPFFQAFRQLPNVHLHGMLTTEALIPALRKADILLVCYRQHELGDIVANSHKLLEYLATGNVVVASYTRTYEGRADLVQMASERMELPHVFNRTLEHFAQLNDKAHRQARIDHAAQRTMPRLLDRIEELITRLDEARNNQW
ncbi:MAG: hypothetical protein JNM31_14480 [Flavobacteriales bacterium]|nr:hypothetical protein [Flavobacteriales bacterium]